MKNIELTEQLLRQAWKAFGLRRACIATSFQKSGMVILDIARKANLNFPVVFINTGYLFPETIEFAYEVAQEWGFTLIEARPRASERQALEIALDGKPYAKDPDMCCRTNKVRPFRRALEPYTAWITNIRRDQSEARAEIVPITFDAESKLKICPLAYWTREDVESYTHEHKIPQQVLFGQGYGTIGCMPCTTPLHPGEAEREGRWRGCGKTECGLHE